MAVNTSTTIIRGRTNPGLEGQQQELATYSEDGYALMTLNSTINNNNNNKSNQILALVKKRDDASTRNRLINEEFQGFKDVAYQDTVLGTSLQVIQANGHYDRVIVFNLTARDYYSPNASLVIYMQMQKADGTAVSKTDVTTVKKFWGRYFTSVKVKKQGDVNVINVNSDDEMTQFNLYLESKAKGYIEFHKDMLTTPKRYSDFDDTTKA